ncbi:MAG: hypothetical protein ACJZ12_01590 [Candidatus Neomarinimicrobiota bacterium]
MSINLIAGVDCGATKVMVQSGIICSDSGKILPGLINKEYYYSDCQSWDDNFLPVSLDIQMSEYLSDNITLTPQEVDQGNSMINTIIESFTNINNHNIGLCFPGLKNPDGITVMANGPRIPDLKKRLKRIDKILNDSDCCVMGEWKSSIGKMQDVDNCVYIGGGTGIADGIILNGTLINLNDTRGVFKSWELKINSKETVESYLSPAGMIRKYNGKNKSKVGSLVELSNKSTFNEIIDHAVDAFSLLIKNREKYFEINKQKIQRIVIGQRLGQFLKISHPRYKEKFQICTDIPIKISSDRRTAALGAGMLAAC